MTRPRHKRIYYIPGVISLAIIPITFILFANRAIKQKASTVLSIVFGDTSFPKKFPQAFKRYNGNFPPKRDYIDINLTGDNQTDKIKLDFAQIRIREMLTQNDSINGLHFKFEQSAQYWTFIKAVDILELENASTYMAMNNDLWFYQFPPDKTIINWICGTLFSDDVIYLKPKVSWWTQAITFTNAIWKSSWQIVLAFAGFLFVIFMLWRRKGRITPTL
jgi:hypothetical protein